VSAREPVGFAAAVREAAARPSGPGTVHVAAWSRDDPGDRVLVQAGQAVPAASTIKVPILTAALSDVASGRLGLDQHVPLPAQRAGGSGVLQALPAVQDLTVADVLTLMIIVSDNAATNLIIELVGMERINSFCEQAGLGATVLRRAMMDLDSRSRGIENTTSALDQATLLAALAWGDLLGDELREFAMTVLRQQQFNEALPALLPDDAVCAHKTGEIPGVRHDAGILTAPGGQEAVVAVLVSGLAGPHDQRDALASISAVGEAAWHGLSRLHPPRG
jgi:beta-lactamase class A